MERPQPPAPQQAAQAHKAGLTPQSLGPTWGHVGAVCIHMRGDEAGLGQRVTRWLIGWGADVRRGQ